MIRHLLICESNSQRIRILKLLSQYHRISNLDTLMGDIETEDDYIKYPLIVNSEDDFTLSNGQLFDDDVIMTEEQFMDRFLPNVKLIEPQQYLPPFFSFIQ